MFGCGCGKSNSYTPNPGNGIDAISNASGYATWTDDSTGEQPATDISNRSPYGGAPTFGGISFCKKCFLTWAAVFFVVAILFFRRSNQS